ncbi:MAG: diaminopimelate epimerase [Candidatus Cohnella colombiensis]|uniref:Diaminopimelate epimerase n=1 Tax=Candidatus Cohnella colombiensis TaxID=3121368 RepID=A0AA95EVU5_9BACL|nr:MAG: diaminopimelate epimerase [Cohnella sp.]
MEFTKMNGLGNDFIVVAGQEALPDNVGQLAIKLCNRFFGIGADGLVFILPSDVADFYMRIINSDGSEAEQCGNAIRCVAKFVYDHNLISKTNITIETIGAGVQLVQLEIDNGEVGRVTVDMGQPILNGLDVPTTIDANPVLGHSVTVEGVEFQFTAVSMGNPHCVIYVEDAITFDTTSWGPKLEIDPLFPRKINVEFAKVNSRKHVEMRVWERGAGPTLACGTGACATLVSSVLNGLTERQATVSLAGGDLFIHWNEADNHVYMTGPAATVFTGSL